MLKWTKKEKFKGIKYLRSNRMSHALIDEILTTFTCWFHSSIQVETTPDRIHGTDAVWLVHASRTLFAGLFCVRFSTWFYWITLNIEMNILHFLCVREICFKTSKKNSEIVYKLKIFTIYIVVYIYCRVTARNVKLRMTAKYVVG